MRIAGRIRVLMTLALVAVLGDFHIRAVAEAPEAAAQPIAVELPPAERQVDFAADILPFLQRNCQACHSASTAEADVVLESTESLRAKHEAGPLVVAGDPGASRLLTVAAHREEPHMPPPDNDVGAVSLTPAELGLLQRWIEQGAKDPQPATRPPIHWQALPDAHRPILATALSTAGDIAVCSRGNELYVYSLQPGARQGHTLATLVDPSLDAAHAGPRGAADVDMIRAIAIHPEADWIASGGFRSAKLWRRRQMSREIESTIPTADISAATVDGNRLAIAGEDGSIQLVDLTADKTVRTWKAHDRGVTGLAFARTGQVLVSVAGDLLQAWQTESGALLATWRLAIAPTRMVLPADDLLITAGGDLSLRVWTLAIPTEPPKDAAPLATPTIEPTRSLSGHGRQIEALSVVPGSPRQFLSGSVDGTVRQWNADDGSQLKSWIHGDAVMSIAVRRDGGRFVSLGANCTAKVWTVSDPNPVAVLEGDFRLARRVDHLARSVQVAQANLTDAQAAVQTAEKQVASDEQSKGKAAAALEAAKKTMIEKATALGELSTKHDAAMKNVAELNQKRTHAESAVTEATKRSGESEMELELIAAAVKLVQPGEQQAAAVAALEKIRQDRQAFLQIVQRDAQSALDASTKERDAAQAAQDALAKQVQESQKTADAAAAGQRDAETTLSRAEESIFSSNKSVEAANSKVEQCQSKLAEQEKLQAEASQRAREQRPRFATGDFSLDGNRLLLADDRGRMFVYDAQSFSPLNAWDGATTAPAAAVFVGDDVIVASRGAPDANKLIRWKASPAWELARTIGGVDQADALADRVLSVEFSPDGSLLATGSGEPSRSGQISIWNVSDGSLVRSIHQPHSDAVFGLAFSPDGEYLASASADRTAKVFRVSDGELVRTFEGHTDHVTDVTWRANGKQLATCSADRKIKVWNFELGEQQRSIDAAGKEITAVTFTGAGGLLVSSAGDRNARIHNADDGAAVRALSGATGYLFCCAAAENGKLIVAGGEDRVLRVWNGEDGAEVLKLEPEK